MKSGDTYRFSLSWHSDTDEQIMAGEFLNKLGNKKSQFIVRLVCDYLNEHPEVVNHKETVQIIMSSPLGERLSEMVRSIIKAELDGKLILEQNQDKPRAEAVQEKQPDDSIDAMLGNLEVWNNT